MSSRVVYRHASGDAVVVGAAPVRRHRSIRPGWSAVGCNPLGRANAWSSPAAPRVLVFHCGHPTANRPYFLEVDRDRFACLRKFSRLRQAQRAAELIVEAGLLEDLDAADALLDARYGDWGVA